MVEFDACNLIKLSLHDVFIKNTTLQTSLKWNEIRLPMSGVVVFFKAGNYVLRGVNVIELSTNCFRVSLPTIYYICYCNICKTLSYFVQWKISIYSFPFSRFHRLVIIPLSSDIVFAWWKANKKTFPGSQAKGLFTSCLGPGRVIASYFSLSIELCMLYHQEKICSAVPSVLLPSFVTYLLDGGGGGGGAEGCG